MQDYNLGQQVNNVDPIAYYSVFAGNFSIWLSIVIGVTASILVLRSAAKMGGGLFGKVMNLMGLGMLVVVVGTLSIVLADWLPAGLSSVIHTALFSIGYVLMVLGANKMLKGIMTT